MALGPLFKQFLPVVMRELAGFHEQLCLFTEDNSSFSRDYEERFLVREHNSCNMHQEVFFGNLTFIVRGLRAGNDGTWFTVFIIYRF